MKSLLFFVQSIKYENEEIERLFNDTIIFNIESKNKKKKKKNYTAFDLIPTKKQLFPEWKEFEAKIKLLCKIAANDNINDYFYIYEKCTYLELIEIIMMNKAVNYELYD